MSDHAQPRDVRHHRALVVGGGPAGLSVAYALQGDVHVLEKEASVGGLCRSIEREGGVFDIGGHSFHTPHPEVYSLVQDLLKGRLALQRRDARVYSHGTLIPYPFQKYYDRLPDPRVVEACESGLQEAVSEANASPPGNFEEFIVKRFGRGIAEHFMLPYNRKLWARDIRKISCEWTSERVAAPKGETEEFQSTGGERRPLQPDQTVGYPPLGGFQEIFRALKERVPSVETDREVVRIDPEERVATTRDGRRYSWDLLVPTLPLPELVRVVSGTPSEVVAMADALEFMSLRVELILVKGSVQSPVQRIYSADPQIPAHKIAFNHNSSDSLRQRGVQAIMAEVSVSQEKPVDLDTVGDRTVTFLDDVGLLNRSDVLWTDHIDVKYAYPVYTHDRPGLVQGVKDWMNQRRIFPVGRFGDWAYVNSDRCIQRGLELGRELSQLEPAEEG